MTKIKSKASLLQEWTNVFKKKKDWKQAKELAGTSLLEIRPKTKEVLQFFSETGQIKYAALNDKLSFESYSKIKLSDSDWKKLATEIPKVCSQIIKIRQAEESPIASNLELQHYFLEQQMFKHLYIQKNKNEKLIINSTDNDYYNKLHLIRLNELILFDINKQNVRQHSLKLNQWEISLEQFYCITRLRIIIETANRASYSKEFDLSEEQKKWIKEIPESILKAPMIKMFHMIFEMIYYQSQEIYHQIVEELKTTGDEIYSPNNIKDFILNLNSFCVQQSYRGHKNAYANYVDLIKLLIKKDLILDSGVISPIRLKNAVKSGLESNQLEWTHSFFNTYKHLTLRNSSENIVQFCQAMIHFYQYEYEDAENILSILPFLKDDLIKIDSLSLYIVTLLIRGRYSEAERIGTNLRGMISRKDIVSDSKIKETQKILHFARLIIKKGSTTKKKHYQDIIEGLEEDKTFKARTWFERYIETKQ